VATQRDKVSRLVERFGGAGEGAFAPSGRSIEDIAAEVGTPFYLYDGGLVADRARTVVDDRVDIAIRGRVAHADDHLTNLIMHFKTSFVKPAHFLAQLVGTPILQP